MGPPAEEARLLRPDGTRLAEFPARGLDISRLLADRLVYTLPDSLHARSLEGAELWSARVQVHKFETAGERTILVRRYVPGEVLHFEREKRLSEARVEPKRLRTDARLRFDCNDFPLHERGAAAELVLPWYTGLSAAWARVAGTRLTRDGERLLLRFDACGVERPLGRLLSEQSLDASVRLALPAGPAGTYRVDLSEIVDGAVAGGMSFVARGQAWRLW